LKYSASSLRIIAAIIVICVISSQNAYAYIDPGAGSPLFQILLAGLLGSLFFIKSFFNKTKKFFLNLFSSKKDKNKKNE